MARSVLLREQNPVGPVELYEYSVLPHFGSQKVPITIQGLQESDNVYALSVGTVEALPALKPDRFDRKDTHPLHFPNNNTRDRAAPVGTTGATAAQDGWNLSDPNAPSIVLKGLNFHRIGDVDWIQIENIPASAWSDCGSLLTASAPEDVHVQLVRVLPSGPIPGLDIVREGQLHASMHLTPGDQLGSYYARFTSQSDAAIEYDATIAVLHLSPIVCHMRAGFGNSTSFSPLSSYIVRWPLAAQPQSEQPTSSRAVFFFDARTGPLKFSGRLLQGRSLQAELLDSNGRRVWQKKVGERELEATAHGGQTFAVNLRSVREGTYFLVLDAGRSSAEVEITPPRIVQNH